jgi:hypothetical protein
MIPFFTWGKKYQHLKKLKSKEENIIEAGKMLEEQVKHKVFSGDYTLYEINKAYDDSIYRLVYWYCVLCLSGKLSLFPIIYGYR